MRGTVSVRSRRVAIPVLALAAGFSMLGVAARLALAGPQEVRGEPATLPVQARAYPVLHPGGAADAFRLDVRLVLIPVTITDPFGVPQQGVPQEAFQLFEDGVEQSVTYFASEDAPVSLGIIFDASGSMEDKIERSRQAVAELLKTSVPGDEFFLVSFADSPHLVCDFTRDVDRIGKGLASIQPDGWTALFDAVYYSVQKLRHGRNPRKALLILSDGGDNNSRYSESETRGLVREADASIFSIGMLGPGVPARSIRILRDLAEVTGGCSLPVKKAADIPGAIARIGAVIRNQYLLGYSPTNAEYNGRYRKVEVRLKQPEKMPPLRGSWRSGYYAPGR